MKTRRNIALLGATGSVGRSVLEVARAHPGRLKIRALAANRSSDEMAKLCAEFRPDLAVMQDGAAAEKLRRALRESSPETETLQGAEGLAAAATFSHACTVVGAAAGAGGLAALLAAARAGKRILLANKEALILAGEKLADESRAGGGLILPIDSEHCALFELLHARPESANPGGGTKLWLTASGGALRDLPLEELAEATPAQALRHPTWQMGAKITVDCATMMNKGLEVMEAAALFRRGPENIGVVLHPQSVAHALVEFADGTLSASLSAPDMRIPVARMLAWPHRLAAPGVSRPGWRALSGMTFAEPDPRRYPCLGLAYAALSAGGAVPAALSAAHEVAVARFLGGRAKFSDIARINEKTLSRAANSGLARADALDDRMAADADARRFAEAA